MSHPSSKRDDARLGMGASITRRDFLNTMLLGTGAALLGAAAPAYATSLLRPPTDAFTGYGGLGDYALANGNTWPVLQAAHQFRDGGFDNMAVTDTGEVYDLVVVGGGMAGLMAAYQFGKATAGARRCLVLENHPMFGGNARENAFEVDGERLIGPQASNDFVPPRAGTGSLMDRFFEELRIPREYEFQTWDETLKPLRFALDNYANMDGLQDQQVDTAYFFPAGPDGSDPNIVRNIWRNDLEGTPFSEDTRRDLLRWRQDYGRLSAEEDRFLDTITYKEFLEGVKGYSPEVTRFVDPFIGLLGGVSADAIAARVGRRLVMRPETPMYLSFPGGNTIFARYLVRAMIPGAISGDATFEDIHNHRVNLAVLDQPDTPTCLRLSATVVRVEQEKDDTVRVTYAKDGQLFRVRSQAVVMAAAGNVNKFVLRDLPEAMRAAYDQFLYAPALVVNVALTHWRFLYDLDATACRWFGGDFGFCCNVRRPMRVGSYDPPLHPDRPTVLTFYMGLPTPGLSAQAQASAGRATLLSTPYADYERKVRQHLATLFSGTGFDPARDIAGIILNRWGHARVIQTPGFYYGKDGHPAPREIVEAGYGRIAIAHSELNGSQNVTGAIHHGTRAAEQVLQMLG